MVQEPYVEGVVEAERRKAESHETEKGSGSGEPPQGKQTWGKSLHSHQTQFQCPWKKKHELESLQAVTFQGSFKKGQNCRSS